MRVCRFQENDTPQAGFYFDDSVVSVASAAALRANNEGGSTNLPDSDDLMPLLPPVGEHHAEAAALFTWVEALTGDAKTQLHKPLDQVQLLVPVPRPNKLFLLAGNYADHIKEGGGQAAEQAETFPYVFMKPPSTTLINPGSAVKIPAVSPNNVDWELELAIVIGRGGKGIKQVDALKHVAGYTVVNDISDRQFRPNPGRKERPMDKFFDWLHGKWHDSFCPCGPCIASSATITDPQTLEMKLSVNGKLHQDGSTAQQIFPVAAVIEFISSFVTLEEGDIISTGTPAGVGKTTETFLQDGDKIEAYIGSIGMLPSVVRA